MLARYATYGNELHESITKMVIQLQHPPHSGHTTYCCQHADTALHRPLAILILKEMGRRESEFLALTFFLCRGTCAVFFLYLCIIGFMLF